MGTNYYRIPTEEEIISRQNRLLQTIAEMDITPYQISRGFTRNNPENYDSISPWDDFTQDTEVHLGKRSMGWKFCWNFHKDTYYHNKATLEDFIRNGRVIDEYGIELTPDEFLEMAYAWDADGWDSQTYYAENPTISWMDTSRHYDNYVDGLRVSTSTDFS